MGTSLRHAIGEAIKAFRTARSVSQESLGASQSYMSELERGVKKNVTFVKIDQVSEAIGVHPITIMTAAYRLCDPETSLQELLARVEREMAEVDL